MFVSDVKEGKLEGSLHGLSYISGVESLRILKEDRRFVGEERVVFEEKRQEILNIVNNNNNKNNNNPCDSSSTSSIGKNSDISKGSLEKSGDSEEVQSSYRGPLNAMESLEQVLPIRRGISRFYNGRSKSFTCLQDTSSTSMKDLAKPENAFIRKSRNSLAHAISWNSNKRSKTIPLRNNGGGISKKAANSSKTTLALATAMTCSSGNCSSNKVPRSPHATSRLNPMFKESQCDGSLVSVSPSIHRNLAWRSLSVMDLQQCEFVSVSNGCTKAAAQLEVERLGTNTEEY